MVPTEFMAAAVAMLTDALAQLLYFGYKFFQYCPVKRFSPKCSALI